MGYFGNTVFSRTVSFREYSHRRKEVFKLSLEDLQKKRKRLAVNTGKVLHNMETLANESYRVADVAHNSRKILDDLDRQFEEQTGLKEKDIAFLFLATGLQVARIVLLNNLTKVEQAGNCNENEKELHKIQKKVLRNLRSDGIIEEKPYYASMEHIISTCGVPYDATEYISDKFSLFKGANHRFATLGHDPVLGLLFGTINIMTNTITCVEKPVFSEGIGIPVIKTNHVSYTVDYKYPRIGAYGSTLDMFGKAFDRIGEQPTALVASLIKQVIHIGTDLYTPCGIYLPSSNLVLSKTNVERLTKFISTGDIIKFGTSMKLAEMINMLISAFHLLLYDASELPSQEVYNVKTRKIIMYSNLIATTSNLIWISGNMMGGNEGVIKDLDIGGSIVTINRLLNDTEYIRQVKEEFVFGGFNKMIQGDALNLEVLDLETDLYQ